MERKGTNFHSTTLQKEAHVLALKLLLEQSIKMREGLQVISVE